MFIVILPLIRSGSIFGLVKALCQLKVMLAPSECYARCFTLGHVDQSSDRDRDRDGSQSFIAALVQLN